MIRNIFAGAVSAAVALTFAASIWAGGTAQAAPSVHVEAPHCVSAFEGKPGEDPTVVTCNPRKVAYILSCVEDAHSMAAAGQTAAFAPGEAEQSCAAAAERYVVGPAS
jgi:hypothetical protein